MNHKSHYILSPIRRTFQPFGCVVHMTPLQVFLVFLAFTVTFEGRNPRHQSCVPLEASSYYYVSKGLKILLVFTMTAYMYVRCLVRGQIAPNSAEIMAFALYLFLHKVFREPLPSMEEMSHEG